MNSPENAVTIGVPVFNGAPRIEVSLESAIAQTYPNLEIVISDNGSTDDTEAICRSVAASHDNVTYLRSAENRGAAWNFNRVFLESDGSYFKWMGHDDDLGPTAIEKAIRVLEQRPTLAIAHWLERIVGDDGEVLREYQPSQGFEIDDPSSAARFRRMLNWRRHGYAGDPIYGVIRRSALEETRLLSTMHNPNYLLLEELMTVGGLTTIPEVLATRVYNDVRITAKRLLTWLDPNSNQSLPHMRRTRQHAHIGLAMAGGSVTDRLNTAGSLLRYSLQPRELKGFAWDIRDLFERSGGRA